MALIEKEITTVEKLLTLELTIPVYQRPYSWSEKSSNILFEDIYKAFKADIDEYRLGTIILHKEKNSEQYNIVDGQQRLTTLAIILYCLNESLNEKEYKLFEAEYSDLSRNAIIKNHGLLSKRMKQLEDDEFYKFKRYILENCTMVKIVTDKEAEAFQFFDSQNSRGKELAPHDLLKAYHLREIRDEDEKEKIKIINRWEDIDQKLNELFKVYLYPMTQWYRGKDGLYYSSSKIEAFKGIKFENNYNHAIYHKASNLCVEQLNANATLIGAKPLYSQFQLTQPFIAGKQFFRYTFHYYVLLKEIQIKLEKFAEKNKVPLPSDLSGERYVKQLYECSLVFFADRFGLEALTESVMKQLYTWSYSLRLTMQAVYLQTINKYAKGQHERVNNGINMFNIISEMVDPEEMKSLVFEKPDCSSNEEKYEKIYELIREWNGWK